MYSLSEIWEIAEDDELRSAQTHNLVNQIVGQSGGTLLGGSRIPKAIVQFWHDSSEIPPDVMECLDSWEALKSQGFKRKLFDNVKARRFIQERFSASQTAAYDRCHHPAMRCDYFRLCYIYDLGGFYIDADEMYQGADCTIHFCDDLMKVQPLCYDVASQSMVAADVFLEPGNHSPSWIYYFNNNPIIAPAKHPVIRLALDRATSNLLGGHDDKSDIQSTTGPGNLTASVVRHAIATKQSGLPHDVSVMTDWELISRSQWPLSYRNDVRNWRLWDSTLSTEVFGF